MDTLITPPAAKPQTKFRFRCSHCDEVHIGLPDVCFPTPDCIRDLPEDEFVDTCLINEDICIVDGSRYFIYCVLEVPVVDYPDRFGWGVWCETDWTPFKRYWDASSGISIDQLDVVPAVLSNSLMRMKSTCGLKCEVQFRCDGLRPLVIMKPSIHELYRVQQEGLTVEQAIAHAQSVGTLLRVA